MILKRYDSLPEVIKQRLDEICFLVLSEPGVLLERSEGFVDYDDQIFQKILDMMKMHLKKNNKKFFDRLPTAKTNKQGMNKFEQPAISAINAGNNNTAQTAAFPFGFFGMPLLAGSASRKKKISFPENSSEVGCSDYDDIKDSKAIIMNLIIEKLTFMNKIIKDFIDNGGVFKISETSGVDLIKDNIISISDEAFTAAYNGNTDFLQKEMFIAFCVESNIFEELTDTVGAVLIETLNKKISNLRQADDHISSGLIKNLNDIKAVFQDEKSRNIFIQALFLYCNGAEGENVKSISFLADEYLLDAQVLRGQNNSEQMLNQRILSVFSFLNDEPMLNFCSLEPFKELLKEDFVLFTEVLSVPFAIVNRVKDIFSFKTCVEKSMDEILTKYIYDRGEVIEHLGFFVRGINKSLSLWSIKIYLDETIRDDQWQVNELETIFSFLKTDRLVIDIVDKAEDADVIFAHKGVEPLNAGRVWYFSKKPGQFHTELILLNYLLSILGQNQVASKSELSKLLDVFEEKWFEKDQIYLSFRNDVVEYLKSALSYSEKIRVIKSAA